MSCVFFGRKYIKTGMIQKRLAWILCKDNIEIHEAFHIFLLRVLEISNSLVTDCEIISCIIKARYMKLVFNKC